MCGKQMDVVSYGSVNSNIIDIGMEQVSKSGAQDGANYC